MLINRQRRTSEAAVHRMAKILRPSKSFIVQDDDDDPFDISVQLELHGQMNAHTFHVNSSTFHNVIDSAAVAPLALIALRSQLRDIDSLPDILSAAAMAARRRMHTCEMKSFWSDSILRSLTITFLSNF